MSEHEAPSAIMWAVKTPGGRFIDETRRDSYHEAIVAMEMYAGNRWSNLERRGYRCIRVKVTEVGYA